MSALGVAFRAEILEQAESLARLDAQLQRSEEAVRQIRTRPIRIVEYVARGTSDNACTYGRYLTALTTDLTAMLAMPSIAAQRSRARAAEVLVVGVSQSGRTNDVANHLAAARQAGSATLAITNDPDGPVAHAAEHVLALSVDEERSVPASKTYTMQLASLAAFWATWANRSDLIEAIRDGLAEAASRALALEPLCGTIACRWSAADRAITLGRQLSLASAQEAALKLGETCYLPALAYAPPDLLHGPTALVGPQTPALVFLGHETMRPSVLEAVDALADREAEIATVEVAAGPTTVARAADRLLVPADLPNELVPIIEIIPAQLIALHLSRERGIDADRPRGLSKVTYTL